MAITVRIDIHEAFSRAAREKSNDEAVKEFLEVFDEVIINRKKVLFDRVVSKNAYKNKESLKKVHDKFVEEYLNAKEKHLSTGLRPTWKPDEDKKNLKQSLKLMI